MKLWNRMKTLPSHDIKSLRIHVMQRLFVSISLHETYKKHRVIHVFPQTNREPPPLTLTTSRIRKVCGGVNNHTQRVKTIRKSHASYVTFKKTSWIGKRNGKAFHKYMYISDSWTRSYEIMIQKFTLQRGIHIFTNENDSQAYFVTRGATSRSTFTNAAGTEFKSAFPYSRTLTNVGETELSE